MVTYSDMLKMSKQEMFDFINTLLDIRCDTKHCDRCPFYLGEYDCCCIANFGIDNSNREELSETDAVHSPMHYMSGGIECWNAMEAAFGVDAEPVRHGNWKPSEDHSPYYTCSECGDCYVDESWTYNGKFNYCPNCGAKMDKEAEI